MTISLLLPESPALRLGRSMPDTRL
jgi:hypothetical protein